MSDTPTSPDALVVKPTTMQGAATSVEQERAIAEVKATMWIARANPRDTITALDLIKQDCTRPSLAERALYGYARGGTDIEGPSIRLAECIARRWGNMTYGTKELERRDGESLMQAFAWDLETNVKKTMDFTVPHLRESKKGGAVLLTDSRDIYEVTANMGARRVRACILSLIPGDVTDEAVAQVEQTLKTKLEVTPERVAKMLELFLTFGVTKEQIEKRIQRHANAETITPAMLLQLGKIANSLRDGISKPGDWFEFTGSGAPTATGSGAMLVSDVLAAGTASGWTVKELMDFITAKFGKALTALERGDQCVAAVQAIVAEAAAKDYRAAPPEGVVVPEGVATDATAADTAENAALDQELAAKESQAPASTPGMDAVSKAAAAAEASLFEAPFTPKPSPAPRGRGR